MRRLTNWSKRLIGRSNETGPLASPGPVAHQSQDYTPGVVWFDVSDLLFFLRRNPNVTGIQRVQLEGTLAMLLDDPIRNRCCFFPKNGEWLELDSAEFCRVFSEFSLGVRGSRAQLTMYLEACGDADPAEFGDDDTLLMLGATWNIPGFFESLRDLQYEGVDCVFYIHDLLALTHPELFVEKHFDLISEWFENVQAVASGMLCNSEETRDAVLKLSDYSGPIDVVDLNIAPKTKAVSRLADDGNQGKEIQPSDVLDRYDLVGVEYVLMVGTLEPRKNHATALNAWMALFKSLGAACPRLVLVGKIGWTSEGISAQLKAFDRWGCVQLIQDANDADLEALYRNCLCSLYISRAEGWGLPITESLAAGKPVVCGAASSARRATQGLAISVDECSERNIVDTFLDLFADREKLQQAEHRIQTSATFRTWQDFGHDARNLARAASQQRFKQQLPEAKRGVFYLFGSEVDPTRRSDVSSGRDFLRGKGWYSPEEWGIWAQQQTSALRFTVEDPQECTAFIRLVAPQTTFDVTVRHKSIELARATVDAPTWIEIPLGPTGAKQDISLSIETDKLLDMSKINTNPDLRVLGCGLAEMCIVPSADDAAKANVLSR